MESRDEPPDGYVAPNTVWLVEYVDPRKPEAGSSQVGGFSSKSEALKCQRRLEKDGFFAQTHINVVPIHRRVEDWLWDL